MIEAVDRETERDALWDQLDSSLPRSLWWQVADSAAASARKAARWGSVNFPLYRLLRAVLAEERRR